MQESAARAEPGAGQPHRRLTDTVSTNQGEVARRPDQWAACLAGVGRAGGQAGEEPAPARGAAWPGAAGKPGRKGRGAAGKAAGPGPWGPAVPISARPGSADPGAGDDAWDREGRRGAGAPLLSPPGAAPAAAARWGLPRSSPLRLWRTASAWLGGGSSRDAPPRGGWIRRPGHGPSGAPRLPGAEGALQLARPPGSGCGPSGPTAGPLPSRPLGVSMLRFKEVHYVCVAHLGPHSL